MALSISKATCTVLQKRLAHEVANRNLKSASRYGSCKSLLHVAIGDVFPKATCSKNQQNQHHNTQSKTVCRFLLERRDIYMRTHAHAHEATNSKKSGKRLARLMSSMVQS